jgi:hypothetical protein
MKGVKLGKFINNYLYKDEPKMSREECEGIRQDNAYITLYGRSEFNKLSDHEKKSRGYWD